MSESEAEESLGRDGLGFGAPRDDGGARLSESGSSEKGADEQLAGSMGALDFSR
jgi:hypothetical protein